MAKKRETDTHGDDQLVWVKLQMAAATDRQLRAVALLEGCTPGELVQKLIDEHLRAAIDSSAK